MIFMWAFGDLCKFVFFVANQQPLQFIICAFAQIIVDFSIIAQFRMYSAPKGSTAESTVDMSN